jgi:iron complex transport system ATP-binding protein
MTALVARGLALPGRLSATDLEFDSGKLIALVGPNGGGKTSLLRALAGVDEATGEVLIDDERLSGLGEARRRTLLAFLPASRDLGWPIAARDVIGLGLANRDDQRIKELVALFELGTFAKRPVNCLSTGERTRVLLARALAARPKLLLLDEPLANLEPYWVIRVSEILRALANEGALILVALHDLGQLDRFDRALLVANGAVQLNEAPAALMANESFEEIFRVTTSPDGWKIRRGDLQSLR